jgi:hypothetical protein
MLANQSIVATKLIGRLLVTQREMWASLSIRFPPERTGYHSAILQYES